MKHLWKTLFLAIISMPFLSACTTKSPSIIQKPTKYEIMLTNISKPEVIKYINFFKSKPDYSSHNLLLIQNNYAELIYSAYATPDTIYADAQQFFSKKYDITLSSNVLKIKSITQ